MNNLEFMKWIPCVGEKHLGVAIIRYEKKIIFRYKVQDGENGLWVSTGSIKTGKKADGKDMYANAFEFDSRYEAEEIGNFIIENVSSILRSAPQVSKSDSVFGSAMPTPSHGSFAQEEGLPF